MTVRSPDVRSATPRDALDAGIALLEGLAGDGRLISRWWRVTEAAVVLSRGSGVAPDEQACTVTGTRIVRRASGGGPVLWTPDLLALDIALPRDHSMWSTDIVESYRWIGTLLAAVFVDLGVPAHAVDAPTARRRNDQAAAARACFAGVSPWEVFLAERKLAGLAQIRRRHGVLLQVGIPLTSQAPLADLLDLSPDEREPLRRLLDRRTGPVEGMPSAQAIIEAVSTALADVE